MGCVFAYVILLTFLGPEYKGKDLGVAHDHDMEEAAGHAAVDRVVLARDHRNGSDDDDISKA